MSSESSATATTTTTTTTATGSSAWWEEDSHIHVLRHPISETHVTRLRNVDTGPLLFRHSVSALSTFLTVEATRDLPLRTTPVQTPVDAHPNAKSLACTIDIIPVLRAGVIFLLSSSSSVFFFFFSMLTNKAHNHTHTHILYVSALGLGMVESVLELLPDAQTKVLHLGFERNEQTLQPSAYYNKLHKHETPSPYILIVDPMLGTVA